MGLHISFFGAFEASLDGVPLVFATDKIRALFAYLVASPQVWHARDLLASMFWQSQPPKTAHANLRKSLSRLRQTLASLQASSPQEGLQSAPGRICLLLSPDHHQVDLWQWDQCLEALSSASGPLQPHAIEALKQTISLYQGHFLAGLNPSDSTGFEQWHREVSLATQEQMLEACAALADHALAEGQEDLAVTYAHQQLALVPWHEEAHQQLLLALDQSGQTEAAIAQYHRCCEILQEQLGCAPEAATTAIYQRLVSRVPRASSSTLPKAPSATWMRFLRAPLFGRQQELAWLSQKLEHHAAIAIVGPGGMGKSCLALATAQRLQESFLDGVFVLSLYDSQPRFSLDALLGQIAAVLGLAMRSSSPFAQQITEYLHTRHLLLLLDDLVPDEQISAFLDQLFVDCPELSLLMTSRYQTLMAAQEPLPLAGLAYPAHATQPDAAITPGIQLFLERTERAGASGFSALAYADPSVLEVIVDICRLVEGMPLALELAATACAHRSCEEVRDALRHDHTPLHTTMADIPPRHRSTRAVFESAWQSLSQTLQGSLARLSLFPADVALQDVMAIISTSAEELDEIGQCSLLRLLPQERIALHGIIRTFAQEKWLSLCDPEQRQALRLCYTHHFLHRLAQLEASLTGPTPHPTQEGMHRDFSHYLQAWCWARDVGDCETLAASLSTLSTFFERTGRAKEAVVLFQETQAQLFSAPTFAPFWRQLQIEIARHGCALGRFEEAIHAAQKALPDHLLRRLTLADSPMDASASDTCLLDVDAALQWGRACFFQGDEAQAERCLRGALACDSTLRQRAQLSHILGRVLTGTRAFAEAHPLLAQSLEAFLTLRDAIGEADVRSSLGILTRNQGHLEDSKQHYQSALKAFRLAHVPAGEGNVLNSLGIVARQQGNYPLAQRFYAQSLRQHRSLGNPRSQAVVLNNLGVVLDHQGHFEEALAHFDQSLALYLHIGERKGAISLHNQRGIALLHMGQYQAASQAFAEALQGAQQYNYTHSLSVALINHALVAHTHEQYAQGLAYLDQAQELLSTLAVPDLEAELFTWIGHTEFALAHNQAAILAYERALSLRYQLGQTHLAMELHAGLAQCAHRHQKTDVAVQHIDTICLFLKRHPLYGVNDLGWILWSCYQILEQLSDPRSMYILDKATRLLDERASLIEAPHYRESYLHQIPSHAKLLCAASAKASAAKVS